MEKWEYFSSNVVWEAEVEQWSVSTRSGVTARGKNLGAALNFEGEQGWELVSLVAVQNSQWRGLRVVSRCLPSDTNRPNEARFGRWRT